MTKSFRIFYIYTAEGSFCVEQKKAALSFAAAENI